MHIRYKKYQAKSLVDRSTVKAFDYTLLLTLSGTWSTDMYAEDFYVCKCTSIFRLNCFLCKVVARRPLAVA